MALSSQIIKTVYAPDGVQTLYAVVFPLFSPQDVQCFTVDAAGRESEITDFTVEGFGTESGVYVRFATPPAAGGSLVLRRNTRQVQETAYPEGGKFPSAVVENDFDRVVGMIQELGEAVGRSLKVNVGEEAPPESAEELYLRVQEVLADAEGARDFSQANAASANQSAVNAAASRDAAAESAELARKWAENPVDAAVMPDHYSAYHWAMKAQEVVSGGIFLSDALDGERRAADRVGASEWALGQAYARAKGAEEAAETAQATADEALLTAARQATETQPGRVYLPTPTELETGEPDEGREGLSIVLPLMPIDSGGLTATLFTESAEIIAEKDGYAMVFCCGGGGGGGTATSGSPGYRGGGGSGGAAVWGFVPIAKGQLITVTVGAGGAPQVNGGHSYVYSDGVTVSASGGNQGGKGSSNNPGAAGASVGIGSDSGAAGVVNAYVTGGKGGGRAWGGDMDDYGHGGSTQAAGTQGFVALIY